MKKQERVKVSPNAYVAWCWSFGYSGRSVPYCTKVKDVDYSSQNRKQVYVTIKTKVKEFNRDTWNYEDVDGLSPVPLIISKVGKDYLINLNSAALKSLSSKDLSKVLEALGSDVIKDVVLE